MPPLLSPSRATDRWDLDQPLLWFSRVDPWTVRDACAGTQIFGTTGSGKTTGSGAAIAKSFLRAGFGGLVLTAKPDERARWEQYAQQTGRTQSLLIFSYDSPYHFDFMEYEYRRPGPGSGQAENLVQLFNTIHELAKRGQKTDSTKDFWTDSANMLLRSAISVLAAAGERVSLPNVQRIIDDAPQDEDEPHNDHWQTESYCYACIQKGENQSKTPSQARDFVTSARFWMRKYPRMNQRTRSDVLSTWDSVADGLLRGDIRDRFSSPTMNVCPELTHEGVVVILDFPEKEFGHIGYLVQSIFKLCWQRAAERRDITANGRPAFLWCDEAQTYASKTVDADFQSTARASRVCTVYLTQNKAAYDRVFGGMNGRYDTENLLANLNTKVFHCSVGETAEYAADLIAKNWHFRANVSTGGGENLSASGAPSTRTQHSAGGSHDLQYQVLPLTFTKLRTGGPPDFQVQGIVVQGGRTWQANDGKNHVFVTFDQRAK